jgi:IS1 family transposase
MNRLPLSKRVQIVAALCEGNSLRATERMCDVSINTVTKLLVDLGAACARYHDEHVRGVRAQRVQCDEIWAFCGAKEKNVYDDERGYGRGSIWTWTALDADSKLIVGYHVGLRDAACAQHFMKDVAARLATRVQLTTDGLRAYLAAVDGAFGVDVDYAQLVKIYGDAPTDEARYSPPACIGIEMRPVMGAPEIESISTSFVERQNLTIRMSSRRFTRLTNAFSKKVENHEHAVALHFQHYNFCRVHKTLRVTPAMAAGLSDHVWSYEELLSLVPEPERAPWGSKSGRRTPTAPSDASSN